MRVVTLVAIAAASFVPSLGGGVGRRQPHRDERVAAQELAVENPGAVEAGGLDVLEQPDQLRHRGCPGDPQRDLNAGHDTRFYGATSSVVVSNREFPWPSSRSLRCLGIEMRVDSHEQRGRHDDSDRRMLE